MAGLLNDTLILKTHMADISGVYQLPGYAQVYSLSGGIYALNENNVRVRLDNITGGDDLSGYATTSTVAAISAGLNTRLTDVQAVNTIQSSQIQSLSGYNLIQPISILWNMSSYPSLLNINDIPIKYIANHIVGNIKSWEIISDNGSIGDIDVDVWYNSSTLPTSANAIAASNHPRLQNQNINNDSALSGWSLPVSSGYLGFQVQSISGIHGFSLQLVLQK